MHAVFHEQQISFVNVVTSSSNHIGENYCLFWRHLMIWLSTLHFTVSMDIIDSLLCEFVTPRLNYPMFIILAKLPTLKKLYQSYANKYKAIKIISTDLKQFTFKATQYRNQSQVSIMLFVIVSINDSGKLTLLHFMLTLMIALLYKGQQLPICFVHFELRMRRMIWAFAFRIYPKTYFCMAHPPPPPRDPWVE